ncbi:MAG: PorV/PorQ family protein [Candidatus Eisenbacteria bacterium]|nr:PorV/PorQ family protein [Candidatus Eisenbacteria bacterium]
MKPSRPIVLATLLFAAQSWISALPAAAGTGLAFLKTGIGARSVSLGSAVVSNVDDPSALYWNPGALGLLEGTQLEVNHVESFQEVRYEAAAITHRRGENGFGASFNGVWTDDMARRDETGRDLGQFGYYGIRANCSYARAVTDRIGLGAGVSLLREQIDTYSTSGLAFDLGIQARELLSRTDLGASVLNLGSSMKYEQESFDLPLTIQAGVTHRIPWRVANSRIVVSAEIQQVRDEDAQLLLGTEYQYGELASLDVGYQSARDTRDVAMGFGLQRDRFAGHYAFVPFSENLGEEHRVSLRMLWP